MQGKCGSGLQLRLAFSSLRRYHPSAVHTARSGLSRKVPRGLCQGFHRAAYLERDFILLPSPDLQAWVVPPQLPEPPPIHGEQSSSHHGRPVGAEEQGMKMRAPQLRAPVHSATPLPRWGHSLRTQPRVSARNTRPFHGRAPAFFLLAYNIPS